MYKRGQSGASRKSSRMQIDSDDEAGPSSAPPARAKRNTQSERVYNDDVDQPRTQRGGRRDELPDDELFHVMGSLLKFLLSASSTKLPIKRADIITYGIPSHQRQYQQLMNKAAQYLRDDFGYKLINIGSQKWIMVNALPTDKIAIRLTEEEKRERTLLFLVLTHLFMSGDYCREEHLFDILRQMKILGDERPHPYFGDVEDIITKKFAQQLYLTRTKVAEGEVEIYQYSWGRRATEELNPREVLNFMGKIYKDRPITSWRQQYRKAFSEPNNNHPIAH